MENNRRPVRTKKKLRKGRLFLTIFLIFIISAATYSIYQFRQGQKIASDNKLEPEQFEADVEHETVENYLILGVDARGEEKSRTDTMMLLSWNRDTNTIKLVSFMRDIYADIPNHQSYKLNTAYYLGGVQLLKDTLNNMFDIPIHHYALIDFKNFETLVDIIAPNGVEIDVEKDMSENIDVQLTKGLHRLNGKELLGYARFRMDAEGDFGRVARQQKVMEALKDEIISVTSIKNIPKFVGATQGYVTTDVTNKEQLETIMKVITSGRVDVEKLTIPQEGAYTFKSYSHAGSVLQIDVEKNKQILHEFLNIN
jgi:polyisoprenyl-teichoic acid--peptidoglycan teichoic acid transferase